MAESDIVLLNVGGRKYATSKATLSRDPSSMLAKMFTQEYPNATDRDGNYVIDRDGDTFKYILNFLRDGSCVLPVTYQARAELLREAEYYQLLELVQQLRRSTNDLSSTEVHAASCYIPDAPTQKLLVLETMRVEAGPENIAGAGRALLSVAYGTRRDSVLSRASSTAKYQQQVLACSPYTAETQVVALELNYRVLAFSLEHTADVMDYPRLEEDYEAYGAHCTGREFARFLWRYQQLLQHDMYLLGYDVAFEKGTKTSEEKRSGVFWVTVSYTADVHPPSPNHRHKTVPRCLQHDLSDVAA